MLPSLVAGYRNEGRFTWEVTPMRKPAFQRCLRSMKYLTSAQRHELKIVIEQVDNKNLVEEVASLVGIPTCCPHCRLPCIRPWGNASGLPRYRCQSCKRTFGPLTNTPLAGLHHKDRWLLYLEGFASGESVRKAARRSASTRRTPLTGGIVSWLFPPASKPGRRTGVSKLARSGSCALARAGRLSLHTMTMLLSSTG